MKDGEPDAVGPVPFLKERQALSTAWEALMEMLDNPPKTLTKQELEGIHCNRAAAVHSAASVLYDAIYCPRKR